MSLNKIQVPEDPRVKHCSTIVNGTTYGYLLAAPPDGKYRATIFLIHGFPDLSMGWRYQIPTLLNLGLRVVAPDCMGYGRTEAPKFTPESAWRYGYRQCAKDMRELAHQLGSSKVILGGHDWGGAIVYRIALYEPDFVTHVFSVCTPYWPPTKEYQSLEQTIAKIPFFGYQAQFANGGLENIIQSKEKIRQFLNAMYGGRTTSGEPAVSMEKGVLLDKLPDIQQSPLLSDAEMDYYVDEYSRTGLHGPASWYRTREQNWKEEQEFLNRSIDIPVLYISATKDMALRPELARNMGRKIKNLTKAEVVASHWALWEKPKECNVHIKNWIEGVVFGGKVRL
ncbi:epoxide hydrolase 2 [Nannizzia gypsea CBS 118893]|uniref:Epoxide hydrolase 2 n=1 Tax=Arthroderma gypseum (strain ATCC MYA-4604 / CBS 118893) TaxID=535722 RepID=E4V422_ARTGP|nr:epoxide hydrolase 2 [Nannizzia gypsea CBS 118893]EFR04746.1 epoxide hydrolase 2 [Nannizzia gypsea CBS 118893]